MTNDEEEKNRMADALDAMMRPVPRAEPTPAPQPGPRTPEPTPGAAGKPHSRVRPAAPVLQNASSHEATSHADAPVDDDHVNFPAPGAEVFLPKKSRARRVHERSLLSKLRYRRTLVPIMLTLGVMLPILAGLWYILGNDSPFKKIKPTIPPVLMGIGIVFLVFGVMNVLQLRQILNDPKPEKR